MIREFVDLKEGFLLKIRKNPPDHCSGEAQTGRYVTAFYEVSVHHIVLPMLLLLFHKKRGTSRNAAEGMMSRFIYFHPRIFDLPHLFI